MGSCCRRKMCIRDSVQAMLKARLHRCIDAEVGHNAADHHIFFALFRQIFQQTAFFFERTADGFDEPFFSQQWQMCIRDSFEHLESSPSDVGGFKEVVCRIAGEEVFRFLKYEGGVHLSLIHISGNPGICAGSPGSWTYI